MTAEAIIRAAELLVRSRLSADLFDRLPEDVRPRSEADGYTIQSAAHRLLSRAGGGEVIGHKIGCTTPVMQAFMGIHSPCAGGVFSSTSCEGAGVFTVPERGRLGVECEIAVVLGRDLPARRSGYSREEVRAAVSACMCGIEVVEDRYVDYAALDTPTLIADDFFNHGAVFGERRIDVSPTDLVAATARMVINGVEVGSGAGAEVMGDPLEALTWLAAVRSRQGLDLRAGELVLLGSLVQTIWVTAGDEVEIENDLLGSAHASFAARPTSDQGR